MEEVSHFYRYIRPQRFDEKRVELVTLPTGGICLRFGELPEGDLFFTYARCHPDDHFSRDVARVIADDRAKLALEEPRVLERLRYLPNMQSTGVLVPTVVIRARESPTGTDHLLIERYMEIEYAGFADVLEDLYLTNLREARRCESWKRVNADLLEGTYAELSR